MSVAHKSRAMSTHETEKLLAGSDAHCHKEAVQEERNHLQSSFLFEKIARQIDWDKATKNKMTDKYSYREASTRTVDAKKFKGQLRQT